MEKFTSSFDITINAPASKVWDALINPEIIKQYWFGANTVSDWKVGSPIFWRGEMAGKSYEDKGTIVELVPEKLLTINTTYWGSLSSTPDGPENQQTVSYTLTPSGDGETLLTLTLQNSISRKMGEQSMDHTNDNWKTVLAKIKEILEK